jgi:hypothetical protein
MKSHYTTRLSLQLYYSVLILTLLLSCDSERSDESLFDFK